jgi:hypothetical protein
MVRDMSRDTLVWMLFAAIIATGLLGLLAAVVESQGPSDEQGSPWERLVPYDPHHGCLLV